MEVQKPKTNYFFRWKQYLKSQNKTTQLVALAEMVESLNNVEAGNSKQIYILMINSDLGHFVSEMMSFREHYPMALINKIVCHLSEVSQFYGNDFFRFFNGYMRVLNFAPKDNVPIEEKYLDDIFNTINIIVQRGREFGCNFNDERFSFKCIVSTLSGLGSRRMKSLSALRFISSMIDLMEQTSAIDENEKIYREQNLSQVLKNLSIDNFQSFPVLLTTSIILTTSVTFLGLNPENQTREQKLMLQIISYKFLAIMNFTLQAKGGVRHLEVFYNTFFYLLTSSSLGIHSKLVFLNRFFILNGHNVLMKLIGQTGVNKKPHHVKQLKSRIILSEILTVFLECFGKIRGEATNDRVEAYEERRKEAYDIVFNAQPAGAMKSTEASKETIMLYTFIKLIDHFWKKPSFNRAEVLANTAWILATLQARSTPIDPLFLKMLDTLYVASFSTVSIKRNQLLEVSSKELLNSAVDRDFIDLKYMAWLKAMGKPSSSQSDKLVLQYLNQESCNDLDNICPADLKVFNKNDLLINFMNPQNASGTIWHHRLKKILCSFPASESSEDFEKLLRWFNQVLLDKNKKSHSDELLVNIADVMNANIGSVKNEKLKIETAQILSNALTPSMQSTQHVKILVIELAKNLMRYKIE